jgi:tRNA(Ile2) C34 agmatinyltransferase TiaS
MTSRTDPYCPGCGGRLDRPGLFRCQEKAHPKPTLAQRIAKSIERDLCDRRGMDWDEVAEETRQEIRDTWAELVQYELEADS